MSFLIDNVMDLNIDQVRFEVTDASAGEIKVCLTLKFKNECEKLNFSNLLSFYNNVNTHSPEPVPLNPSRLAHIIIHWHPSKNDLRKSEVISDLIKKVKSQSIGTYSYVCSHSKYELVVSHEGSYLFDFLREKKYRLIP